jgi:hypothetical protein
MSLIVSGKYNEVSIIVYGEIHNQIDQDFYEGLDLGEDTVWVEHSTRLCMLLPEEEFLFQKAKGLEWIWFTRTKQGNQVRCIDYRIEMGLMSRIEEIQLSHQLDNIRNDAMMIYVVEVLVDHFKNMLMILKEYKTIWTERRTDVIPVKTRMFDCCDDILASLPKVLDKSIPFEEMHDKCMHMYKDLCLLSSILLDTVIVQQLKEYTDPKPIHIFVGLAHAERLQRWLQLTTSTKGGRRKTKTRRRH